jgi:hypothetical protein
MAEGPQVKRARQVSSSQFSWSHASIYIRAFHENAWVVTRWARGSISRDTQGNMWPVASFVYKGTDCIWPETVIIWALRACEYVLYPHLCYLFMQQFIIRPV